MAEFAFPFLEDLSETLRPGARIFAFGGVRFADLAELDKFFALVRVHRTSGERRVFVSDGDRIANFVARYGPDGIRFSFD